MKNKITNREMTKYEEELFFFLEKCGSLDEVEDVMCQLRYYSTPHINTYSCLEEGSVYYEAANDCLPDCYPGFESFEECKKCSGSREGCSVLDAHMHPETLEDIPDVIIKFETHNMDRQNPSESLIGVMDVLEKEA